MAKEVLKRTLTIHASQIGALATHLSQPQKMSVEFKGQSTRTSPMGPQDLQHGSEAPRVARCISWRLEISGNWWAETSATERDKTERMVDQIMLGDVGRTGEKKSVFGDGVREGSGVICDGRTDAPEVLQKHRRPMRMLHASTHGCIWEKDERICRCRHYK